VNTQRLRSMFSRQNVLPCTLLFLLIVVAAFGFRAAAAQSPAAAGGSVQRPPFQSDEEMKKDFNDDDLKEKDDKPVCHCGYSTLLDSKKNDPSAPAYVSGIQILSGGGKYQGIHKIKRVEVRNRSSQTIVLVQVRVEVIRLNEPEKVLLEEEFPFANASIAPNSSQVVDIKTLYPPRLLKALANGGELNGEFGIRMGVQAIRFADGSFWKRPEPTVLLRSPYLDHFPGLSFPDLASLSALVAPPLRSSDTKRADMPRCTGEPRLAASAFSSLLFEYDTCTNNSSPHIDLATGKKSCGDPGDSTCYAHCSDDGWCDTWQSDIPCSGPSATPPSNACTPAEPKPADCCVAEVVNPGTLIEYCQWNCDNCQDGTQFSDGCKKVDNTAPSVCADDG
jgi:hypothetical protein